MMIGVKYVVDHRLANVISMSFGATEETFPAMASIKTLLPAFTMAAKAGIPITAGTGDTGAAGNTADSTFQGQSVFPSRAVAFPADVPSVIGVGGTKVEITSDGRRITPDQLIGFSGAGLSKAFARPAYQNSVRGITKSSMKSIVSITMDGGGGTSQSAPLFAGILALAAQLMPNGRLGDVNSALYSTLGPRGSAAGIIDVTEGNDTFEDVPGFSATKGFDIASGWGTIYAPTFVPALVKVLK